jgi:CO/xanthine dehydrogenase Mo-binding subunit
MQDNDYRVVGKPVPRIDGKVKVTGTATFADDLFMPRMQSLCACPH